METPLAAAPPRKVRNPRREFHHSENQAMATKYVALHQVVLVDAGPGTGKSSQIPRLLHAGGHGRVVCSQTYRLAAVLAATRAAADMRAELGRQVGYSVPLDDRSSDADTVVKYITYGALLRELAADPLLTCYGAVVVDDAHDGMTLTGVVLSCVKATAARRLDLRVVVCLNHYSTLCKGVAHGFFSGSGMDVKELWFRTYSGLIDQYYLPESVTDYLGAAVDAVCRIHSTEPPGDLLVFLPGCTDVEAAEHALNGRALPGLATCCLHDGLPMHRIHDVFRPAADGRRKVVLCSVFVDGIKYIVDSGYYGTDNDVADGDVLLPVYTREEEKGFPYAWNPANKMADVNALAGVILTLKALGIIGAGGDDVVPSFDFFEPPHPESIHWTVRTLKAAGALSQDGEVTETGRRIAREISGRYY
ncbi:probable pre-mRNA-splicing factor ATP-dependent RNA helicase DEAH6 [Oryza glaberrima]|uniref:probable pre-mRNA-splicing factor ATP-dependent RNA helicase DEAH6 n=1 Tax=Oryza glaberrima TaxID=4538 RepID=UPI00224C2461|nr:probable pre-mRNA-splicing factor ATP-dependent RNA helicase DEAH6 [Oryza glaberrima]